MANSVFWKDFTSLELSNTEVGDEGAKYIASVWKNLTSLDLWAATIKVMKE